MKHFLSVDSFYLDRVEIYLDHIMATIIKKCVILFRTKFIVGCGIMKASYSLETTLESACKGQSTVEVTSTTCTISICVTIISSRFTPYLLLYLNINAEHELYILPCTNSMWSFFFLWQHNCNIALMSTCICCFSGFEGASGIRHVPRNDMPWFQTSSWP